MPRRSLDLHGNAPHESKQALLMIDTINDMAWDKGTTFQKRAVAAAKAMARLKKRAALAGVPTIYVNDNFGQWQSNFRTQVDHCLSSPRARVITKMLEPTADDYYILKAKHSGFYGSPLHLLLEHIQAKELILTGFTTESCVLFTAVDAFLRDFDLIVPPDCVASCHKRNHDQALTQMKTSLSARVIVSARIRLRR